MFTILDTKLRPLAQSFELVTGRRPSPATLWRWKNMGVKGVMLPYVQVGGIAMISPRVAQQWLSDVTIQSQKNSGHLTAESSSGSATRQREAKDNLALAVGLECKST